MLTKHSKSVIDKNISKEASASIVNTKNPQKAKKSLPHSPTKLSKKEESFWLKIIRKWIVVIFTGGMFLYNVFLFEQTKQQSFDASAKAESSFALSKKIAESQERFAKIETRAYVILDSIHLFLITGAQISIHLTFINTGRTPANNFRAAVYPKLGGTGIYPHEIDAFENQPDNFHYQSSIGAGMSVVQDIKIPILFTKKDSLNIVNHNTPIFFLGLAIYEDMFGGQDTTRFCLKYTKSDGFIRITKYNTTK